MLNLQILPEREVSLQVLEPVVKTGQPVILPRHITQNGIYSAKAEGAAGFDPVTVEVDMTSAKEEGYQKGVAETEAKVFWTKYIVGGRYLFHKAKFPENAEVVLEYHDICSNLDCLMRAAENVKKFTLICENPNPTLGTIGLANLCPIISTLEYVDLSRFKPRIYNLTSAFSSNPKLKEVAGEIDYSLCTHLTNTFQGDTALEKISVTPGSIKVQFYINNSPNLTDETIQAIIDGLADLTGATTQTLSLHKTVGGKLTQAQKDAISAKNWTLVY